MMTMHDGEIVVHTVLGGVTYAGTPCRCDFRVYSLLLFGTLLLIQGGRVLRAAWALPSAPAHGHREALRATLVVLLLAAPLIPIHAFFRLDRDDPGCGHGRGAAGRTPPSEPRACVKPSAPPGLRSPGR